MNHIKVAKLVFCMDAVLGVFAIGGAALYGATYSSENAWIAFFSVFVPFTLLWLLFCYGAYKGLTSQKAILKFVFWLYVAGHFFGFPVGTAVAGVSIWLWRNLRKPNAHLV